MKLECIVVGKPTPNRLVVAASTSRDVEVLSDMTLRLRPEGGDWTPHGGQFFGTAWERDLRHIHFWLTALSPDTSYEYELLYRGDRLHLESAKGQETEPPASFTIKTPPKAGTPAASKPFEFIVAGDQEAKRVVWNKTKVTARVFRQIQEDAPAFFIHCGDIFHKDGADSVPDFRSAMRRDFLETARGFLGGMAAFRVLDDHDFATNGLSADKIEKDPKLRNRVENAVFAFNELWPVRNGPVPHWLRGVYYQARWGDADFWFINGRVFATKLDGGTLLGDDQKRWLLEALHDSNARMKFVVTPLPFFYGKNAGEDFRGNHKEWRELLFEFERAGVNAIFTADSHNYSRVHFKISQDPDNPGAPSRLIPQFLVGTLGGRPQHDLSEARVDPGVKGIGPTLEKYYSGAKSGVHDQFGYLRVRVDPTTQSFTARQYLVGTDEGDDFREIDSYS